MLEGSVGAPGFGIQMPLTENGVPVSHLDPGLYTFVITDRTTGHSFHVRGKDVDFGTGIAFSSLTPVVFDDVQLNHGYYDWVCDVHPTAMFGEFTVGNYLKVEKDGPGYVSTAGGLLDCGPTCEGAVPDGGPVELVATPWEGYEFRGWVGGGCAGTGPCAVSVSGYTKVTAVFRPLPVTTEPPPPPPPVDDTVPATVTSVKVVRNGLKRIIVTRLAVTRDVHVRLELRSGQRVFTRGRSVELLPGSRTVRLAIPRFVPAGRHGLRVYLSEFLTGNAWTLRRTVRVPRL